MEELVGCMTMRMAFVVSPCFSLVLLSGSVASPQSVQGREPIIDMHLHAHTLSMYGTPPPAVCTNDQELFYPGLDPREPVTFARVFSCRAPLRAPETDEKLLQVMLEMLERYNIRAVATGRVEEVAKWRAAAPDRIIPATPYPRLRVYVMHYGSPLVDEMISMLFSHPQLYVDVAGNDWSRPRKEFHSHLRRLVDAGHAKRILFGSDAMVWPQTIPVSIESIETADFLSPEQKRDIFYHNAVRFLRLKN
jgi:Amidohydrolase